ncbi:STE2 [Candida margitis]|uniref:STE2 n=1 Tax=Candida margitis TaxID=1775924 RepID=UPI00222644EA|nr:STE2 [Candida margitis]KAI5969604.1 STE2 [Candida margitis]
MDQVATRLNSGDVIITITIPGEEDGTYEVPFYVLDEYHLSRMENAIILGVTIGACSILLVMLVGILFKNFQKLKKSLLFNLNFVILLMLILRSACYINYLMNNLSSISFFFTGIFAGESFMSSDAANAFKVILVTLIEMSLTYQTYVMFKIPTLKIWGLGASFLAGVLGLATIATQIYTTVMSHVNFINGTTGSAPQTTSAWMDMPTILFSVSVNVVSLLLICKLGLAIRTRRYLGLRQFDTFHILLIMSTQTMIIPSIILFVHYFDKSDSSTTLVNVSLLLVVISLPLSSLWAQTANNIRRIDTSPSISFLTKETSNGNETLHSGVKVSKYNTSTSVHTLSGTLKDDSSYILDRSAPEPKLVDTGLPKDLEKFLNNDFNEGDDGMIAREVTTLKTQHNGQ